MKHSIQAQTDIDTIELPTGIHPVGYGQEGL